MSRKKKNQARKKVPKNSFLTGVSHGTTFVGYVLPNTFLYFEGLLAALNMIIAVLKHQLTTNSGVNVDINSFFVDPVGKVSFGLAVVAILSLTASNQSAYADMIEELWHRSAKKGKRQKKLNKLSPEDVASIQKFLTDLKNNQSTNIESIKNFLEELKDNEGAEKIKKILNKFADADIAKAETIEKVLQELTMEEAKQPEEMRGLWQRLQKFLKICANLIGTHVKGIVTVAAVWRMLERLIQSPYLSGALTSLIILPCAELAQFAILGRKQNMEVFKWGLISFGVTTVTTVLAELIVTFAVDVNSAAFAAMLTCGITLFGSTLIVAEKESNLFGSIASWIKESCCSYAKQSELVVNNNKNGEMLFSQNKQSSCWDYWCCWNTRNNNAEQKPLLVNKTDLKRSDSEASLDSISSRNSFDF